MQATLDPKQLQRFRDPVWRLSNLYAIRTRDGKVVPFRPRPQQLQVLQMIYRQGLKRIVILKARQLGFSTLLGIICTDQLCWTTGKQLSLIDRTQENSRQKLRDIVALAYDSLHNELKARFIVDRSNAGELGVRFHEYDAAPTSTLFAAPMLVVGRTRSSGFRNGVSSNARTFAALKRFSPALSRAPRMAPLSSKRPGEAEGAATFGIS
jgi:hypothetical protein